MPMRKRLPLFIVTLVLLFGSTLTAHATQTLTEDGSVNIPLTAVIDSKYSVSIPAALTLTAGPEEAGEIPFFGLVEVGVKGNINPGKAVVVVPTQGILEEGELTAASITAGNTAISGITTEALNEIESTYQTEILLKGTANAEQEATISVASHYVRWANEAVTPLANCEAHLNNSTYTKGNVTLTTRLSAADTYKGNLQFTFKLVDRL